MIKLYLYRLGGFLKEAALSSRAERCRLISKTAYKLLCQKYAELTGLEASISKTDRGKPYIVNSSIFISISHCDTAILFAFSDKEIGVDIEFAREFSPHSINRLFSEKESEYINSGQKNLRSTLLWTMREAVCKATGEGFSDWFFSSEFVDGNYIPLSFFVKDNLLLNLKSYFFDDLICTAAAVSTFDDIEFFDNDL